MIQSPFHIDHPFLIGIFLIGVSALLFWCYRAYPRAGWFHDLAFHYVSRKMGRPNSREHVDRTARNAFKWTACLFAAIGFLTLAVAVGLIKNLERPPLDRAQLERAIEALEKKTGRRGPKADDIDNAVKAIQREREANGGAASDTDAAKTVETLRKKI